MGMRYHMEIMERGAINSWQQKITSTTSALLSKLNV